MQNMTQAEQRKAAEEFAEYWKDKGDEKQESQRFWISLLGDVFGIVSPANYIEFEKRVKLSHTSYIDAYIADTKVLIEQKGATKITVSLHHIVLIPFRVQPPKCCRLGGLFLLFRFFWCEEER